eukprot:CAMPEP_0184688540 /NCGR_PEP_ID=MMETSP0312-20130426/30155_1 /TAXON_ID=31354 /ORGANISM="Compsopogon coeruleus, Strain SAG 36.94" /LENGTH=173 /DNA_ID=CAMNT_0027145789 /DNA_START=340 /DNA_END=861 /DNA_ORIENTATION=+
MDGNESVWSDMTGSDLWDDGVAMSEDDFDGGRTGVVEWLEEEEEEDNMENEEKEVVVTGMGGTTRCSRFCVGRQLEEELEKVRRLETELYVARLEMERLQSLSHGRGTVSRRDADSGEDEELDGPHTEEFLSVPTNQAGPPILGVQDLLRWARVEARAALSKDEWRVSDSSRV